MPIYVSNDYKGAWPAEAKLSSGVEGGPDNGSIGVESVSYQLSRVHSAGSRDTGNVPPTCLSACRGAASVAATGDRESRRELPVNAGERKASELAWRVVSVAKQRFAWMGACARKEPLPVSAAKVIKDARLTTKAQPTFNCMFLYRDICFLQS